MERYKYIKFLGKGGFGHVVEAYDEDRRRKVAIKMFSTGSEAEVSANQEIKIGKLIRRSKAEESHKYIIQLYDYFRFEGNWCIVSELLSINLEQLLRKSGYSLTPHQVHVISKSLLSGLDFLHQKGIIHADLKLDNIMLKNSKTFEIKIIDFGLSIFIKEAKQVGNDYYTLQNQYYRAPEIYLKVSFDEKIDIFSVGCILVELCTGTELICGNTIFEHLGCMVEYLGLPPRHLIISSQIGANYFVVDATQISFRNRQGSEKIIPASRRLEYILREHNNPEFVSFLNNCLMMDPLQRGSAKSLLGHPWLTELTPQRRRSTRSCSLF